MKRSFFWNVLQTYIPYQNRKVMTIMKKIVSLVLAALMLLGAVSCFAEGNTLTAEKQDIFVNEIFLADGQMPEVQLSHSYASGILNHDPYVKNEYIFFPLKDGAKVLSFDTDNVTYYCADTEYTYGYQAMESYSYEKFLGKAADDEEATVVADGTDGWAAYVICGKYSCRAYVLVDASILAENAKLYVSMQYHGNKDTKDAEALSLDAAEEAARLKATMTAKQDVSFWTENGFDSVRMDVGGHLNNPEVKMTYTFPELTMPGDETQTAREFVTRMSSYHMDTMLRFAAGSAEIDYAIDSYSYVSYKKEEESENVHTVRLADGYVYDIYYDGSRDKISYIYVSRLLTDKAGNNGDRELYLEFRIDADDMFWTDLDGLCADLNKMVTAMTWDAEFEFLPGELAEEPAAPAEPAEPAKPAEPAEPAEPADPAAWTCPGCGRENDTNYCPDCGAKRP